MSRYRSRTKTMRRVARAYDHTVEAIKQLDKIEGLVPPLYTVQCSEFPNLFEARRDIAGARDSLDKWMLEHTEKLYDEE